MIILTPTLTLTLIQTGFIQIYIVQDNDIPYMDAMAKDVVVAKV
jgi:hypothetical protein